MSLRPSLIAGVVFGCGALAGCGTDSVTVTASTFAATTVRPISAASTTPGASTTVDTGRNVVSSTGGAAAMTSATSVLATTGPATTVPGASATAVSTTAAGKTIVLSATSLGVINLGASKEDTVSAVSAVLGQPTAVIERQPSFSSFGTCPGTFVEAVSWGDLLLLFGDGDDGFAPGGVRHVFNWSLSSDAPDGPRTKVALANGVKLGSTVAEVEAAYRNGALVVEDAVAGPSFAVGGSPGVSGTTTGTADTDTVVYLEGGVACGE